MKSRHGGAILVRQVHLLQKALTAKCSLLEPLTKTVDVIYNKIDHAFDAGEVMKDLLKSIAVLSALSNKSFNHICSIISHDIGQTSNMKTYGPAEIGRVLEEKQTLLEADKSGSNLVDMALTALAAKVAQGCKLICSA